MRLVIVTSSRASAFALAIARACAPVPALGEEPVEVVTVPSAAPALAHAGVTGTHLLRFPDPFVALTRQGETIELPAGVFLSVEDFGKLDREVIRLQDAEVRLTAENASLAASLADRSSTWIAATGAALGVIAAVVWWFHPK